MSDTTGERVEIRLQEGMRFLATNEYQASVVLDAAAHYGGSGEALGPMEMLLIGLGTCTGMDVISILRKKRQDVAGYTVVVEGVRASEHPRVFTRITVRHVVRGTNVSDEAVRRAIELSEFKYCPAFAMLSKAAEISSSFEILPPA